MLKTICYAHFRGRELLPLSHSGYHICKKILPKWLSFSNFNTIIIIFFSITPNKMFSKLCCYVHHYENENINNKGIFDQITIFFSFL